KQNQKEGAGIDGKIDSDRKITGKLKSKNKKSKLSSFGKEVDQLIKKKLIDDSYGELIDNEEEEDDDEQKDGFDEDEEEDEDAEGFDNYDEDEIEDQDDDNYLIEKDDVIRKEKEKGKDVKIDGKTNEKRDNGIQKDAQKKEIQIIKPSKRSHPNPVVQQKMKTV
ncbi:MAG: hypothetical protein EZS28_036396, partial [Streblomastix strix]